MKTWLLLCICLFLFPGDSLAQKPVLKTPGGARYSIVSSKDGRKIERNDIITVSIEMLNQDGELLYSSYKNGEFYKVQVHDPEALDDLMEVFINLHEKDSALVFLPVDSIYKNNEAVRPPYLPRHSNLIFHLKVERVQTFEEALSEEKSAFENERELILQYIKENQLSPQATSAGILYHLIKAGGDTKPASGDTVYINYAISVIGGKVFDTNIEGVAEKSGLKNNNRQYLPISFIIGESGEVTPWDEAIMLLGEGAKVTFIIPSFLAFGSMGLGKIVKPYTTFVIELEIVKVRKLFARSFAEKEISTISKDPGKRSGLNYFPRQLSNKFTSFLLLMSDPQAGNRVSLATKSSSLWYLVWWDAILKLFN